ncbi:MAG: hypothetical protein ACRC62_18750 [Microcoleus sp.]
MDNSIINLGQQNLLSHATQQIIGVRNIDLYQTYRANSRGASRSARLGGFFNMLKGGLLDYFFSNFTAIVMGAVLQLYMFNWNATDKELQDQMKANELAMITAGGRLIADGMVQMMGVGLVKQAKHRFPRISPTAIAELEEENREETIAGIRSFLMAIRSNVMNNVMLQTYMSGRHMLGMTGTEKKEPWILADQVEKIAESQKDDKLKALIRGFTEQAEDRIFDLAYLVCNTVTATYEMNRLAAKSSQGPSRLVQLTPDKDNPELKTLIYGNQQDVMTQITAITTQNTLIDEKDIGQVVAVEMDKAISAPFNMRSLSIRFYSTQNGKISYVGTDGSRKRAIKAEHRIPSLKVGADWDNFKAAIRPFERGNWLVTAKLKNGRDMSIYTNTPTEGEAELRSWITLTDTEIVTINKTDLSENVKTRKEICRMFPKSAKLRVLKETADRTKAGYIDRKTGNFYRVKTIEIPLMKSTKPDGIDQEILNPWGDS